MRRVPACGTAIRLRGVDTARPHSAATRCRRATRVALCLLLVGAVAACGRARKAEPPPSGETFGAGDTYSRTYAATPAVACEAARRALLGQGYVIGRMAPDSLEANKNFQPGAEVHTQLNVRATCVPQAVGESIVFVNAVQDRYVLKTQANSASVGVSMVGSVSLPIGSSNANLVRTGSNTVQNQEFYRRFFERVAFYLPGTPGAAPPTLPKEPDTPPDPVEATPAPAPPPAG